jgi:multiple sugar transport system permease protein
VHARDHPRLTPLGVLPGGIQIAVTQRTQAERVAHGIAYSNLREIDRRPLPPAVRRQRFLMTIARHAVLIAFAAMFVAPFIFVVLTAVMTDQQAVTPSFWPRPFVWGNYNDVFDRLDMVRYFWNTAQIGILSTVGVLFSCIPVAYALARMRWRGRQIAFVLVLSTIMLPIQVTIVPLYIIWVRLGQIGHLTPLILPSFLGDAFSIFLLRQFFLTIPEELSDAARVDGATEWQIMTRVIIPLAKPAIAAVALFNFLYNWNDLFSPLLFLGENQKLWTLTLALTEFQSRHGTEWNLTMAAAVVFMLPVIILFFLSQRVFVEGVTLTGVKG